jgi:glycosyltransferase involved in cell wall biosynthesis
MDDETTRQADLVFVTSDTLLEAKSRLNTQISVSPHGVEFEHFARSQDPRLPVPNDIAQFRGPVVGFFGLIERFIDLELIDWIAEQRPQWQFVFVGRVAVPAESLPCRANVHFLGKRPYESLPGYAKRFDACIIPYRAGDWSYHANPLKLREYLAAGKPVVAVSTPQTEKFADVVETARTREEFLAGLDRMLERPPTPTETTCRMAKVADASWAARAEVVVRELRTALAVDTSVSLAGS